MYFWRTYDLAEIDLVEEIDGHYNIFEFKLNSKKKIKFPKSFIENYPVGNMTVIDQTNFYKLIE